MRSKPASARGFANSFSRNPLVVNESLGALGSDELLETISTISARNSGSPPVSRTSSIPTATAFSIISISSSVLRRCSDFSQSEKS